MMRRKILWLLVWWSVAMACSAADPQPSRSRLAWGTLAPLPDPLGVAGAFAGVAGDENGGVLVVAGGTNFPDRPPWENGTKTWHAAVHVLPAPDAAWAAAPPLPRPLGSGVSATYGGRVWCVGGGDATEHLGSTVSITWDAAAGALRLETDALPPLPRAMALGGGVLVGSRLYVAGGLESPAARQALGMFCSIDLAAAPAERRWREHPTWPGPPRILPTLGAIAGRVYLVSGATLVPDTAAGGSAVTRRFLTDAHEFDPGTETWRTIASCPVPLAAAPGPAIPLDGSRLVFLPGDDGEFFFRQQELAGRHPGFPRQMHRYDAAADTWHRFGTVPDSIRVAAVTPTVAWRGAFILPSGEVQPGVRSPQVVRLAVEPISH